MGAGGCKFCQFSSGRSRNTNSFDGPSSSQHNISTGRGSILSDGRIDRYVPGVFGSTFCKVNKKTVDRLILQVLGIIGHLVESAPDTPEALQKLNEIADKEEGWIQMIHSMVNIIPLDNPLGPVVITVLLDDCPLPNKDTIVKLSRIFSLSRYGSVKKKKSVCQQRNVCIILGMLAEKLAGPSSVALLTPGTLAYLVSNLEENVEPILTLFSLVALEKFAQTSENKLSIKRYLETEPVNPILKLERFVGSQDYVEAQVGFCAQWCLDNLFVVEGRKLSYESIDLTNINAMLNSRDASEYLKISPDGLEARCDAYLFESVRCTFPIQTGIWYYEITVLSCGVMQIGWATKKSKFLSHEGYGIGDDGFSVAYDGCRQQVWHNAHIELQPNGPPWKPGCVLGCLLDLQTPKAVFYLNGNEVATHTNVFKFAKTGFFAAASFMAFQHCRFNFGRNPFKYPPKNIPFQSFNAVGVLNAEERVILPRHLKLEKLRRMSVKEDSCTLCFDFKATVTLKPCNHSGFCENCSVQLLSCPVCRASISSMAVDNPPEITR
nr:PREDICTED: RING finger and SPRY domain-containing protein 1-like [Bemisia tabaci]